MLLWDYLLLWLFLPVYNCCGNAIAIVGTNPVSGMTLMTLIISSVILVSVGLKVIWNDGGVDHWRCCLYCLSMAGGFITDLKIGYWLGSSPYKQQSWKFLGTLLSAATVGWCNH